MPSWYDNFMSFMSYIKLNQTEYLKWRFECCAQETIGKWFKTLSNILLQLSSNYTVTQKKRATFVLYYNARGSLLIFVFLYCYEQERVLCNLCLYYTW